MQYLTLANIKEQFQISKSTVYRWIEERNFPRPTKFSTKAARWRACDIEEWIESIESSTRH
ncbi:MULTISPECIES: AlpA family transcriptional regulator [Pseudidiomarina]|uniref:AlpA family transcriptional regulator n=2 Tax=Pseudidiomarina TaxID=2800384 RepID=A0A368USA2_9GAMM|nr:MULTISPECIES: AlpA family phage regulatory protein [Pseudidiomarina]PWW08876.1 AlpA family transcriptional regulator [Pseudidiomarina maritima]RBP90148.1 AlpA family transcriptional regulator [Pseudidiomarina tainanensis]RCW31738.1 AlpA family transcriptional regulator [Pseudidiomarina tainanensis]